MTEHKYTIDCKQSVDIAELENLMLCARWLVLQMEELSCFSLANIFQKALDDSEAWIKNMICDDSLVAEANIRPFSTEAEIIRKLLVKYAGIKDQNTRDSILRRMELISDKKRIH